MDIYIVIMLSYVVLGAAFSYLTTNYLWIRNSRKRLRKWWKGTFAYRLLFPEVPWGETFQRVFFLKVWWTRLIYLFNKED